MLPSLLPVVIYVPLHSDRSARISGPCCSGIPWASPLRPGSPVMWQSHLFSLWSTVDSCHEASQRCGCCSLICCSLPSEGKVLRTLLGIIVPHDAFVLTCPSPWTLWPLSSIFCHGTTALPYNLQWCLEGIIVSKLQRVIQKHTNTNSEGGGVPRQEPLPHLSILLPSCLSSLKSPSHVFPLFMLIRLGQVLWLFLRMFSSESGSVSPLGLPWHRLPVWSRSNEWMQRQVLKTAT